MNKPPAWIGLVLLGLAACAPRQEPVGLLSGAVTGEIEIRDPTGRALARAGVSDSARVRVRLEASGLVPGTYGVHIHEIGRCDPPDFQTAGPHWNPAGRQHGTLNPLGHHMGDLPNLTVGTDGAGVVEFTVADSSTSGGDRPLFDRDGAALVIHASPDDYRTDPSGNSGARLACGVIAEPR